MSKNKQGPGGVAQLVECLPSKHEAPSSNPSIAKKKQKQQAGFGGACL
jgi:hypothetical protein